MNKKFFWSILSFVMIAIFSPAIMSCGGDDDDMSNSQNDIVGNYTISGVAEDESGVEYNYTGTLDIMSSQMSINISLGEENYNVKYNSSYSINGNTITFYVENEEQIYKFTLSNDRKKLNVLYVSGKGLKLKTIKGTRISNNNGSSLRVTKENIVGKWILSGAEQKYMYLDPEISTSPEGVTTEDYLIFYEDGTAHTGKNEEGYYEYFKWYIEGNKVITLWGENYSIQRTMLDIVYLQDDIMKTNALTTYLGDSFKGQEHLEYLYFVWKRVK